MDIERVRTAKIELYKSLLACREEELSFKEMDLVQALVADPMVSEHMREMVKETLEALRSSP